MNHPLNIQNYKYMKIFLNIRLFLVFSILLLFNISLCLDCPRDKPILKKDKCESIYCKPNEFEKKICVISNPFIKTQWLNKISNFGHSGIFNICPITDIKGNLFLLATDYEEEYGTRYLYAFSKDGNGYFYNKKNDTNYSFETIKIPSKQSVEIFNSVYINNKVYLLSVQNSNEMILLDLYNKNYTSYKFETDVHHSENVFKLKGFSDDEDIYFTSYIYFGEQYNLNKCYLGLRLFKLNLEKITIISENQEMIRIHYKSSVKCFQNDDLYIQCIYNTPNNNNTMSETFNHIITLFNYKTLEIEYNEILDDNYRIDTNFDSTIQLNGNIFATGYSYPNNRNVIKLMLKKFKIEKKGENEGTVAFDDYLPNIKKIDINSDEKYVINKGNAKRNCMVKINENKFAILLNEYSDGTGSTFNKNIIIFIINIFNSLYISIRHYKINFSLYNLIIIEDLRGYNFNNFFGVLLETGVDTTSYVTKATFITFGYVNSTYDEIPIDKNLRENNTNSVIILKEYISEIQNNLFGYKFVGVKIIHLPVEQGSGYFINNKTNEKIKEGDIVSIDTVLRFILVREALIDNEFSIDFAGVVQEPDYDEMNENAERVDIYPINDTELEREFYTPKLLIGRVIKYKFDLSCYESCSICDKLSNNPNDQKCIKCINNYYFQKDTQNCFESLEGYYLDNSTQQLYPCHPSCASCNGPENSIFHMNCLSCYKGYTLYESTNCLRCAKYINPELTECFDEIPDGYFLKDKEKGFLGKCHELCKTCFDYPEMYNMNCIECKYLNYKFTPEYDGQCPSKPLECPRDKPILIKNKECNNIYCTQKEFNTKYCTIYNTIIKTQWMNNIQRFGKDSNIMFISLDYGLKGELFLFAQRRELNRNQNYIYGVDINGEPFFQNKNFYKIVDFPSDIFLEKLKFVKNYENDNTFFISTQIEDEMYGIDYDNNTNRIYTFNYSSYSSDDIFTLKEYNDLYFTNFIYCQNIYNLSDCSTYMRKFKFESKTNEITIIYESVGVRINSETNFICFDGYNDYIQCVFTVIEEGINKHVLGLFNSAELHLQYIYGLERNFKTDAFFDSMIKLNDEVFVIAYSTENNIIKILIDTMDFDYIVNVPELNNYIFDVPYILINEDNFYNFKDGLADRNNLCKINDKKFAMLVNYFIDTTEINHINQNILIYIFSISFRMNVSIRKYVINFGLYNMYNYGKILGYKLGEFFGIFIELSSPKNKSVVNSAFMTFGYVNTTEPSFLYDNNFILDNNLYSKDIIFSNYIKGIENNLFGYEFIGVIIISLPDKSIGNFVKSNDEEIAVNQTLNINSEIKLKLKEKYKSGNYSIVFAGAVKEAEYDKMNEYADEILNFPNVSKINEKSYYEPQTLIGKRFEYSFELKNKGEEECYPSCLTCYAKTEDDDNHQCEVCQQDYYFKEFTRNCYKEINKYYYFDEDKKMFSACYIDCLTCSGKEFNSSYMNCLSCEKEFKYYFKSNNCLKCPKYVNYLQTECIDSIPDGFFLDNEEFGTIEKCHNLCKTCKSGPYYLDNEIHMNCETCLYTNKKFVPSLEGDCPENDEKDDSEPVDGQCPRNKPILKDNKCKDIYCTKEEFDNETCKIYNNYIKIQWLNNFHIFGDIDISYAAYDMNENGDLFLFAQKEDTQYNRKYLYGFSSNGTGILYEKTYKNYTSFKTIYHQMLEPIHKIKYIKINNEEYLLNILKNKQIYLFDYNNNEIFTKIDMFSNAPYSVDTMIKLRGKENIYFFDFIFCSDQYIFDHCYIRLMNYKIESISDIKMEASNTETFILVSHKTKLTCIEDNDNFIKCTYTTQTNIDDEDETNDNQHMLGLFDKDKLTFIHSFILASNFSLDITFDSIIELKENVCVIAYSINPNLIHVMLKRVIVDENKNYNLFNYLNDVPYININEDSMYEFKGGNAFRNDLLKINENEFVMLINDFKEDYGYSNLNSGLVIIIFHLYNDDKNILIRHYKIDFSLYNMYIDGDVIGYKLNGFIGALVELTSPEEKYRSRAAFLTFGYVNTTEDISIEDGTYNLINKTNSIIINNYITGVENNLLGYEFIGVKIISLPDETKVGYFINIKNNNEKIKINDIIDINSELKFVINNNPNEGNYILSFAGVVKEVAFYEANNYSIKIEHYPNGSTFNPEKYLNEPKILTGKEFKYNFSVKKEEKGKNCYKNCETCIKPSDNINEQECLTCKDNFYFKDGTKNCYDTIEYQYYFNEETKTFSPCYKDCLSCKEKEINSTHMNCLKCHNFYKYYEKSKNCLKCPKFVNFDQTDCIDSIPEGYFLADVSLGTLGKCHDLCKTCNAGPVTIDNIIYMNCDTCLYINKKLNLIVGNCPETPGERDNEGNTGEKNSNFGKIILWISLVVIVLILIVVVFIFYKKRSGGKNSLDNNIGYFNIEGKNIPLEDQRSFGIN